MDEFDPENPLVDLGWTPAFETAFAPFAAQGFIAGRIGAQYKGGYGIIAAEGDFLGDVSGRFRHQTQKPSDFPAVGDWVAFERPPQGGRSIIHACLPRRTQFSRTAAGLATEQQVLAANVDDVLVVEALAADPNLRRLERFLTLAWESGATPHVVLTKSDLCDAVNTAVEAAKSVAAAADVHAVCSITGKGMRALRKILKPGRTAVVLGASGVGKSTLINVLNGEETQAVIPIRDGDNKGRHTTTHREIVLLPNGGLIIDTPGLREIQLWEGQEGVAEAFPDIAQLALSCRFGNCKHQSEPGCAVRAAITAGTLDKVRFESFEKLLRESRAFESRHSVRARLDETRRSKIATRSLRKHPKFNPGQDDSGLD